jgi:hypothetical protein
LHGHSLEVWSLTAAFLSLHILVIFFATTGQWKCGEGGGRGLKQEGHGERDSPKSICFSAKILEPAAMPGQNFGHPCHAMHPYFFVVASDGSKLGVNGPGIILSKHKDECGGGAQEAESMENTPTAQLMMHQDQLLDDMVTDTITETEGAVADTEEEDTVAETEDVVTDTEMLKSVYQHEMLITIHDIFIVVYFLFLHIIVMFVVPYLCFIPTFFTSVATHGHIPSIYIYVYLYMYMHMHIYLYRCAYICTYIAYIHTCICIFICVLIYLYIDEIYIHVCV